MVTPGLALVRRRREGQIFISSLTNSKFPGGQPGPRESHMLFFFFFFFNYYT